MKKIKSLFMRNYETDRLVRDEVVSGAGWVIDGKGTATEKIDGTCCMIKGGKLYKRYDYKPGRKCPPDFEFACDPDPVTGRAAGWVPVTDEPQDKWHKSVDISFLKDSTYELVGPKVQGNPYRLKEHYLLKHGEHTLENAPRTFQEIKKFFADVKIEGIVWYRENGDMVKIKARDFGFKNDFIDSYLYEKDK